MSSNVDRAASNEDEMKRVVVCVRSGRVMVKCRVVMEIALVAGVSPDAGLLKSSVVRALRVRGGVRVGVGCGCRGGVCVAIGREGLGRLVERLPYGVNRLNRDLVRLERPAGRLRRSVVRLKIARQSRWQPPHACCRLPRGGRNLPAGWQVLP